jgi:protein SCO1/2
VLKYSSQDRLALVLALLLITCLAACDAGPGKTPFNAVDITGADYASDFVLSDQTGKQRALADFKGKVVVLFFGYTHCPDVCPTTMADLAKVMKQLGADAASTQVLFVTLDPKRDTPTLLSRYVPAFNPNFLGLYGDEAATKKVAKDFHIFYEVRPGASPDSYTVDHTAGTFVFDREGRLRLFLNYGMAPEKIAADMKRLLS